LNRKTVVEIVSLSAISGIEI